MSGWDTVDVGFGDETANFGPRLESGSPLYQIETKATISHTGKRLVTVDGTDNDQKTFSHMTFTPQTEDGFCDLVIVSRTQVHLLKNINVKELRKELFSSPLTALTNNDMEKAQLLHSQVTLQVIDVERYHTELVLFTVSGPENNSHLISVGSGKYSICVWEKSDNKYNLVKQMNSSAGSGVSLQKCLQTHCGNLLCLDTEGTLSMINLQLLTVMKQWEHDVIKDFGVMEMEGQMNENSLTDVKLILLASSPDGVIKLEICLLLMDEPLYSLVLSPWTFLVETAPYELVYKAKANQLLNALLPWNVNKLQPDEMADYLQQLHSSLKMIKDESYATECCITAVLPTFHDTFELLLSAKQRLTKAECNEVKQSPKGITGKMLTKVIEILYRLETYQKAYGEDNFRGESWSEFVRVNMLNEVISQLRENNIITAAIIWNRHQAEIAKEFTAAVLKQILDSISDQASSDQLKPWLADDFLPFVIRVLPEGLPPVVNWIEQKARSMEIYEKMCTLPVRYSGTCQDEVHNDTIISDDGSDVFHSFNLLVHQLEELLHLHTKYKCKLSLARFIAETTESLAFRILDRIIAVEFIPSSIENYFKPFLKEHNLDEDWMLFQYIKYKLQATYDVIKAADVPWSDDIKSLARDGLATNHSKTADIKELTLLAELQKILIKYRLRKCIVKDDIAAQQLVHYIINQNKPSCLEDALHVTEVFQKLNDVDVYVIRIHFLIEHNELEEVIALLHSLPDSTALECGGHMLNYVKVILENELSFDEEDKQMKRTTNLAYMTSMCQILNQLLKQHLDVMEKEELQHDLELLTLVLKLQVDICIPLMMDNEPGL
ncbi:hypothetical protein LSH36_96g02028 [Paralvinella palmiformis]|uniref:RZZ complex subunit KNTC1/ROD C-terminal domain-containing protein n=1 Tax=Paralvinella palmiformis TaxID=53620 RepID=A0AAD9K112_9ANNE|nr:hypothetical protein LSH36_96g02028 [Paralvinella palmiformis]